MIPLRPELFTFTDPKSLCLLTCTSKTLRKDVRESKAWARLAEAQLPPAKPRDAASDALSRVRSLDGLYLEEELRAEQTKVNELALSFDDSEEGRTGGKKSQKTHAAEPGAELSSMGNSGRFYAPKVHPLTCPIN